ncbi:gas vesicle protein [Salipaludibacillus sp. CF4.18]|uniref:gas vesicle protein n=1 Tax=Salipaludibacillus sp. CF4.18 TaxID=3373081 RepID=UPI003EE4AEA4
MDNQAIKQSTASNGLVDILETVLDKGVVIAGDIQVNIADVELLTIKIRLMVASVDKAKEIGMDWWETDPHYSSKGLRIQEIQEENEELHNRIKQLEENSANPNNNESST